MITKPCPVCGLSFPANRDHFPPSKIKSHQKGSNFNDRACKACQVADHNKQRSLSRKQETQRIKKHFVATCTDEYIRLDYLKRIKTFNGQYKYQLVLAWLQANPDVLSADNRLEDLKNLAVESGIPCCKSTVLRAIRLLNK